MKSRRKLERAFFPHAIKSLLCAGHWLMGSINDDWQRPNGQSSQRKEQQMTAGPKGRKALLPGTHTLRPYRYRPFCIFQLVFSKRGANSTDNANKKMSTGKTKGNRRDSGKVEKYLCKMGQELEGLAYGWCNGGAWAQNSWSGPRSFNFSRDA